jgi:acyl carrier protein
MASYEEIVASLYEVLEPFAQGSAVLTEDTELVADLGLDSLKIMDMLLWIEDRFDASIPLNVLTDVRTVRDLAVQLEALIGQPQ